MNEYKEKKVGEERHDNLPLKGWKERKCITTEKPTHLSRQPGGEENKPCQDDCLVIIISLT
jgi:hypothetical protein